MVRIPPERTNGKAWGIADLRRVFAAEDELRRLLRHAVALGRIYGLRDLDDAILDLVDRRIASRDLEVRYAE